MKKQDVADRYAHALAACIERDDQVDRVLDDLRAFAAMMQENPDLAAVLANPTIPSKQRRAVLVSVLDRAKPDPLVRNFLLVLFDRKRIALLPETVETFVHLADRRLNRVSAKVFSATSMTPKQEARLREGLATYSGKSVRLETAVDPSLLGGVVVRLNGTVLDGSLRSRLERLRRRLLKETAGEN